MKIWARLFLAAMMIAAAGCSRKRIRIIEGTNLAVGISMPQSDNTFQLQAMNYLSGFSFSVPDGYNVVNLEYKVAESNSYFGVIHTNTDKAMKGKIHGMATDNAQ